MTPTSSYPYSHSKEIKTRTPYIVIPSSITPCCSYRFSEQILYILAAPLAWSTPSRVASPADYGAVPPRPDSLSEVGKDTLSQSAEASEILEPHSILTELTEVSPTHIQIPIFITPYSLLPTPFHQLRSFIKPGPYLYEKEALRSII